MIPRHVAAAAAMQLTSFSSLRKCDLICSQFDLSEAIRCFRSKRIIFFHQKTNLSKIIIVFGQKRKICVVFAISSVFFLVAFGRRFFSFNPTCSYYIGRFFGESQATKKEIYKLTTNPLMARHSTRNATTMTHMFFT